MPETTPVAVKKRYGGGYVLFCSGFFTLVLPSKTVPGRMNITLINEYVPEEMKAQGSGYGLFEVLAGRAKADGIARLLIEADKSRCVGFYEKWGCLKINEASLYDA